MGMGMMGWYVADTGGVAVVVVVVVVVVAGVGDSVAAAARSCPFPLLMRASS